MYHLNIHWDVIIFIPIAFLVSQIIAGVISGWLETKNTPKEPMFLCKIHGPIRKENTITFSDYEGIFTDLDGQIKDAKGDFEYCTLCLHERLKTAERIPK